MMLVDHLNTLIRLNGNRLRIIELRDAATAIVGLDGLGKFVIGSRGHVTQINYDELSGNREQWLEGILAGKTRNEAGELV